MKISSILTMTIGLWAVHQSVADVTVPESSVPKQALQKLKGAPALDAKAVAAGDVESAPIATFTDEKTGRKYFHQKTFNKKTGAIKGTIVDGFGNEITVEQMNAMQAMVAPTNKISDQLRNYKSTKNIDVVIYLNKKLLPEVHFNKPTPRHRFSGDLTAFKASQEQVNEENKTVRKNHYAALIPIADQVLQVVRGKGGKIATHGVGYNKFKNITTIEEDEEPIEGLELSSGTIKASVSPSVLSALASMPEVEFIDSDLEIATILSGALNTVYTKQMISSTLIPCNKTGLGQMAGVWHAGLPNTAPPYYNPTGMTNRFSTGSINTHFAQMVQGIKNSAPATLYPLDNGAATGVVNSGLIMGNWSSNTPAEQENALNWMLAGWPHALAINHSWYNSISGTSTFQKTYGSPALTTGDEGNTYTATDRYIDAKAMAGYTAVIQAAGNLGATGNVTHKGMNTIVVGAFDEAKAFPGWTPGLPVSASSGANPVSGMTAGMELPHVAIDVTNWQDKSTSTASSLATGIVTAIFTNPIDPYWATPIARAVLMSSGSAPQNWGVDGQFGTGLVNTKVCKKVMDRYNSTDENGHTMDYISAQQSYTKTFTVTNSVQKRLTVALAWVSNSAAGLDDLDLTVRLPDGVTYLVSNTVANNAEVVSLNNPPLGTYTVTVYGYNVRAGSPGAWAIAWNNRCYTGWSCSY
jgi:hypothetical protein